MISVAATDIYDTLRIRPVFTGVFEGTPATEPSLTSFSKAIFCSPDISKTISEASLFSTFDKGKASLLYTFS